MALYDIVWLCGNVHVHTEPLNTNEHETCPNLGFVLTLIPLRKKSALWAQIRLLADGAKEKETLESEDMDTRKYMLAVSGQSRVFTRADSTPFKWALGACYWRCICILYTFCTIHIVIILLSIFIPYVVVLFRLSMGNMGIHILVPPSSMSYLSTVDCLKRARVESLSPFKV